MYVLLWHILFSLSLVHRRFLSLYVYRNAQLPLLARISKHAKQKYQCLCIRKCHVYAHCTILKYHIICICIYKLFNVHTNSTVNRCVYMHKYCSVCTHSTVYVHNYYSAYAQALNYIYTIFTVYTQVSQCIRASIIVYIPVLGRIHMCLQISDRI